MEVLQMEMHVSDILRHKGNLVVSIDRSATVYQAIEHMVEENVGSILVSDESQIVGIFTERDYLRRVTLRGRRAENTLIEDVMTTELIYVEPTFSVGECLAIMTRQKIRHLPVMHEGELCAVISIGDCVRAISDDAQANVQYLTDFITGRYPG
jgi:CBS domain-containing protein